MHRYLLAGLLLVLKLTSKGQCPQVYDYLGNLTANPQFISCSGNPYALNFQSTTSWGAFTINWGDGSPVHNGASYTANSIITHTYSSTTNSYVLTVTIPALNCTLTAPVVVERPVSASIQIPIGGVTQACAPKTLTFTNSSTNVSSTTTFTWNFGDGSPPVVMSSTNAGQNVTHQFNKGTVNCQTQVTLLADNYCRFGNPSTANYNPIQIYDIDIAAVTPDRLVRCFPDATFLFSNTTARNCLPEGNTFQRQERWNLGDYWGMGHDSIIGWNPWPPSAPLSITYPGLGTYSVHLLDSNMCGVDDAVITVSVVSPPTASLNAPALPVCQSSPVTFTNASSPGFNYLWNFGAGGGFVNLGNGNKNFTYNTPGTYTVRLVALIAGAGTACTDTSVKTVTVLPAPQASFALSPTVGCNSLSNVTFTDQSTGAAVWSWTLGNGNNSSGQIPTPQTYNSTGTFVITLAVTGTNNCVHTRTRSVVVHPKPVPGFAQFSACVGIPVNFTNTSSPLTGVHAINSYKWDFDDGSAVSTVSAPLHTYTSAATYTVKLVTSSAFCIDSISQTIPINQKPVAGFVHSPTVSCPPLNVSFTNTSVNGQTYLWKFGPAPSATSSVVSPTFIYTNTTQSQQNYTVTLIALSGAGCVDSVKQAVSVHGVPAASFNASVSAGCSPFAAIFNNSSAGASTYSWSFGDGNGSTQANPIHTYTNNSLFQQTVTAQLSASNAAGCSSTFTQDLVIYAKPVINITMVPSSGCHPLGVNFPPVPGVATYSWTYGDGSPQFTTTIAPHVHTFSNTSQSPQVFTVGLTAANGSGCFDSAAGTVTVYPNPTISLVVSPSVGCSPHLAAFTSSSNIPGSGFSFRFGDASAGTTVTTGTTNHQYVNPGSTSSIIYTSQVTVVTPAGCKDSLFRQVLVHAKPLAQFIADTPRCVSSQITFTNQSLGAGTYSWTFGDNSPGSVSANTTHIYPNTSINNTTYSVQLIVISPDLCSDTVTNPVLIFARPVASLALSQTVGCTPLNVAMNDQSQFAHMHQWEFGDGGGSGNANTVNTYSNSSRLNDAAFTVKLKVTNNNSCSDSAMKQVLVYPVPLAQFGADTPACSPRRITFTNTSVTGSLSTFNWDLGSGGNSNSPDTVSRYYVNPGGNALGVQVTLTVTNNRGCSNTRGAMIYIHPKPFYSIGASPDSGCTPLRVNFSKLSGAKKYIWILEPGRFSNQEEPSNLYENISGTTRTVNVELIASDEFGCSDTAFKTIRIFPKPTARFTAGPLQVYVPNQSTRFVNLSSPDSETFKWDFGDGGRSEEKDPVYTYTKPGTYKVMLIASTAYGCKDTSYLDEDVLALSEATLQLPNAFSPSLAGPAGSVYDPADNSNDIFHPNVRGTLDYQFSVFSRWGELLFDTRDPKEGWDGYYNGKLCTSDVYIWKVVATFVDGQTVTRTGDVLLVR